MTRPLARLPPWRLLGAICPRIGTPVAQGVYLVEFNSYSLRSGRCTFGKMASLATGLQAV